MKSTAAVMRTPTAPFSIETLEVADPGHGELAVDVAAAGMCHTDVLARELPPEFFPGPIVRGHEGAGTVTAVGPGVSAAKPGDKVILSFNSCGECPACQRRKPPYCFNFMQFNSGGRPDGTSVFTDANGEIVWSHYFGQSSFASHTIVAERSVVKVDSETDLAAAAPLACGVQTGAGAVMNSLAVEAGAALVIAGAGTLGLAAIMAAKIVGADPIIAIDRHASRLELAEQFGATHRLSGDPASFPEQIREITGAGADYAFDATGNAAVVRSIYDGLNNLGTLGMSGVGAGEIAFDMFAMITGRTITGIMEGDSVPQSFIPELIDHHNQGRFPYDQLITRYPLSEISEAERASGAGEVVKPVLVMP